MLQEEKSATENFISAYKTDIIKKRGWKSGNKTLDFLVDKVSAFRARLGPHRNDRLNSFMC